jgi:UDP-N-acetyl-D-galactosamine dehydrogenase
MNIDTNEVLDAASTKWNFLNFKPGLVGGHCIGVDPYYIADKSTSLGYKPEIILSGRELNNSMGDFVADEVMDLLKKDHEGLKDLNVLVLGVTFKENCPDYRNTKVVDLVNRLKYNLLEVDIYDPWVDRNSFYEDYNLKVNNELPNKVFNAVILAVSHDLFKEIEIDKILIGSNSIIYDIKGFFNKESVTKRL